MENNMIYLEFKVRKEHFNVWGVRSFNYSYDGKYLMIYTQDQEGIEGELKMVRGGKFVRAFASDLDFSHTHIETLKVLK